MLNLTPVVFGDDAAFRAIVLRTRLARRARLAALLDDVLERYAEYRTHRHSLEQLGATVAPLPVGKDCYDLYDNLPAELEELKEQIFSIQTPIAKQTCQYCTIGIPDTLDHYAPRATFPEFSIFSMNLVPCCFGCNHTKDQAWTNAGGREIVNLYYDLFIAYPILEATIRFLPDDTQKIEFNVISHPRVTPIEASVFKSHLTTLGLLDRFVAKAALELSIVRGTIQRRSIDLNFTRQFLADEAEVIAGMFGANHWRTSITRALAASEQFLEVSFGAAWLPAAQLEVSNILSAKLTPCQQRHLRRLVDARAWRLAITRGDTSHGVWSDWFPARHDLGIPLEVPL